jgi:hypothetical protein
MVYDLIEEKLREKAFGDISSVALEAALSDSRETILAQVQSRTEALKAELLMSQKDGLGGLKRQVDGRLQDFANSIRETRYASTFLIGMHILLMLVYIWMFLRFPLCGREVVTRNKASTKELSANVAKALSNKIDRADLKRVLKEQVEAGVLVPESGGKGSGRGAAADADIATLRSELDALRHQMGAVEHTLTGVRSQVGAVQTAVSIAIRNKDSIRTGGKSTGGTAGGSSSGGSVGSTPSFRSGAPGGQTTEASVRAAVSAGWDSMALPPPYLPPSLSLGAEEGGPLGEALTNVDLRIALGEMSFALRKELSEKVSKAELYQALKAEFDVLDRKLAVSCNFIAYKNTIHINIHAQMYQYSSTFRAVRATSVTVQRSTTFPVWTRMRHLFGPGSGSDPLREGNGSKYLFQMGVCEIVYVLTPSNMYLHA